MTEPLHMRFRQGPNGEKIRAPSLPNTEWGRVDYLTESRAWETDLHKWQREALQARRGIDLGKEG